jgi:hypothetical protein
MINTFTVEKRKELNNLFQQIAEGLDITETQFNNLVRSYNAVGKYLEEDDSFKAYRPVVTPQGSLRLGTIIQPITEDCDIDVDLVYRLNGKSSIWTQKDIKQLVGKRLKDHGTYSGMLDKEEGRRCWTLLYRQDSDNAKERYHIDILPSVSDSEFNRRYESIRIREYSQQTIDQIAIRITDNKEPNYGRSTDITEWLKSNPDGYALWFAHRCKSVTEKRENLFEAVMPIGKYVKEKTILQRIVQILKRHRDIMFKDDEDKPISIIITTLAGRAYNGESSLLEGLYNVVGSMESHIKRKPNGEFVISNPVNPEENFADKWPTHPKRKENFFKWLRQVKSDVENIMNARGLQLRENVGSAFGEEFSKKMFNSMADQHKQTAINAGIKVGTTGVLGSVGKTLNAKNTFFGEK